MPITNNTKLIIDGYKQRVADMADPNSELSKQIDMLGVPPDFFAVELKRATEVAMEVDIYGKVVTK